MCEQHLRLAGLREKEEGKGKVVNQHLIKRKSQYSAVASKTVKQKLQEFLKRQNRKSLKQAEFPWKLASFSDLEFHHQPNPSASQNNRDSCCSSSNMSAPECCCPMYPSTCQSQGLDYRAQPFYENERDSSFMTLSERSRTQLHRRTINLPPVSPKVVMKRPVPLCRSRSQPLVLRDHYSRCHIYVCNSDEHLFHPKSCQTSPGPQSRDERVERKATSDEDKVRFSVEEYSQSSNHPDERLQLRPNVRSHASSCQSLTSTQTVVPVFYLLQAPSPAETCRTGLAYDRHLHDERMRNVWLRLRECGLTAQCKLVTAKPASMEDTSVVCKDSYFTFHGAHPWSHHQLDKARIAAGTVTELALLVAQGNLKNGFAIVQKLKHHDALELPLSKLMSSFSSVAVAAKQLQQSVKKILIVDWDVHHRSTVQELFYTDPRVLYISLHQYCETMASSKRGGPNEVGLGEGEGFNVNVPWSGHLDSPIGDTEYMEAFRTVVMPIAHEFSPDMVLVSSEFNAVDGHPASQGGYRVSAKCFGVLTQKLMKLARGRVVVVLECDHDLNAICDASEECINALLYRKTASLSDDVFQKKPCANAVRSLQKVLQIQSKYWSSVRFLTQTGLWLEAERKCSADNDAPKALSSLSLGHNEPAEHDEDELPMWEKTG